MRPTMPDGQTPVDRYTGFPGRATSKHRRRFQVPSSLPSFNHPTGDETDAPL